MASHLSLGIIACDPPPASLGNLQLEALPRGNFHMDQISHQFALAVPIHTLDFIISSCRSDVALSSLIRLAWGTNLHARTHPRKLPLFLA